MRLKMRKIRIAQILLAIIIIVFGIRETRLLREIEELKYFDLAYWGIHINPIAYTLQNMMSIGYCCIFLIYLIRRDSLKVESQRMKTAPDSSPKRVSQKSSKGRGKRREKNSRSENPFEKAIPQWKVVFENSDKKES